MTDFSRILIQFLSENSNAQIAQQQSAYMKNKFEFFGLKAPKCREIYKPFLAKNALPQKDEAIAIAKELYAQPQRELHYFAMELMFKYKKVYDISDISWIEFLITHNSWWDTVDYIADKIAGAYLAKFPEQISPVTQQWVKTGNIWLQRSALLFQLKYKDETDTDLLENYIEELAHEKEFFIRKAIGWVLREYAKTDAYWVRNFVHTNEDKLSGLSVREALKNIA